jgi:hypothetical protein
MSQDGRLYTLDGFFHPGHLWLARYLVNRDRGKFVRDQKGYMRLAAQVFGHVSPSIRMDLFHVPYPSNILECKP